MPNLKRPTSAHDILDNAERQYKALKVNLISRRAGFLDGGNGREVLSLIAFLKEIQPPIQLVIDTAGINDIAIAKYSDSNYNIVTNLSELLVKIIDTVSEIIALIPTNGGGYMLLMSMNSNDKAEWRTFTGAQLLPVVAKIDAIIAMID